ncbi:hypothetical protein BK025_08070 [Sodalis sp. TME1]|nr:hypothetical protein BK025_08070 [Sodalis sp. TME1]
MNIFVVNLKDSVDRRKSVELQLNKLNLQYEVVEAVDGRALSNEEIMQHTRELNYACKPGEIGCSLSHLKVYRKIVEYNIPYALILEDDIQLSADLPLILTELPNIINKNTPSVTLLTHIHQYDAKIQHKISPQHALHVLIEASCSHGYVINASAAQNALDSLYPVWMVADRWKIFREYSIAKLFAVLPPVISHSELSKISIINDQGLDINTLKLKKLTEENLYKKRPIKIKLKRILWLLIKRPFMNIIKQ